MLHVGQAQKEIFHNEALYILDNIVAPVVQDIETDPAILSPEPGESWIVGIDPIGLWTAQENKIASWSENGWRFMEPKAGMLVMDTQAGCFRIFQESSWFVSNSLSGISGGTVVDDEARTAISSIIDLLRNFRFLPDGNL